MNLRATLLWTLVLPLAAPLSAQNFVSGVAATLPSSAVNWAKTLRLPAYEGALGAPTEAKLTRVRPVVPSVQAENPGDAGGRFTDRLNTSLAVDLAGLAMRSTLASAATVTQALAAFDGVKDFARVSGFAVERMIAAGGTRRETGPAEIASFTGPGGLDFLATATGITAVAEPGDLPGLAAGGAALDGESELAYPPIPEPKGSAVLIGVLGFGLMLWGRRLGSGKKPRVQPAVERASRPAIIDGR